MNTVGRMVLGFWVAALAVPGQAEGSPTAAPLLPPVTVTATRVEQSVAEATRAVQVVERSALEQLQPQSVAQAVAHEANVDIAGGPRADNQEVNIRGLTGSKVLQTVDGARQVFESGHRPSYFLDPELLKSVEVLKGPSSGLWGSGAVGGVVAQTTVDPADLLEDGQRLGGLVKTGYNSNNHQWSSTLALAGMAGSLDWMLSAYQRDGNDIELGNGEALAGSAARNTGGLVKAVWHIDEAQSLSLGYRQAEAAGTVPTNGAAPVSTTSNFLIRRDNRTENLAVDYRINPDADWLDARLQAYANSVDMNEVRISDGRADSTSVDVQGLNLSNRSRIGKVDVLYGLDGYQEAFSTRRAGLNRPAPMDAESTVWGAFVQATVPLAEHWSVELGTRYDRFTTESRDLGTDTADAAWSPSLALIWEPTDWARLVLRRDQAFRAPSSEELYSTGTHFCVPNLQFGMGPPQYVLSCNTFVSSPYLKPETGTNTELLARLHWANLHSDDDALIVTASYFRNRVDDFIEQITYDPLFSYIIGDFVDMKTTWVNVDEAQLTGFELAMDYRYRALRLKLAYGQTRGEDRRTRDDLSMVPADNLKLDIGYGFLDRQLTAGLRSRWYDDQERTPFGTTTASYDGYVVTDLYASWEPKAVHGLKLDLSVNNLEDRYYRMAWDTLYQPGREVIASVRYRF